MKTKIIKVKVDILLVEGCTEAQYHEYKFGGMWLNQVRWKVVNFIDKLTEEQADGLVDRVAQHYIMYGYTNIMGCWTDTALKSFQSLLEANDVLSRNQFERPNTRDYGSKDLENDNSRYWKLEDKWREAEAKVFNPSTTLIFVKK